MGDYKPVEPKEKTQNFFVAEQFTSEDTIEF
jgi:hypothetical protein